MIDVNMGIHKIIQRVVFNENFKRYTNFWNIDRGNEYEKTCSVLAQFFGRFC